MESHEKDQEIIRLELQLGIKFPLSYCQFLVEYGSGVVDGHKILGIKNRKTSRLLLIKIFSVIFEEILNKMSYSCSK